MVDRIKEVILYSSVSCLMLCTKYFSIYNIILIHPVCVFLAQILFAIMRGWLYNVYTNTMDENHEMFVTNRVFKHPMFWVYYVSEGYFVWISVVSSQYHDFCKGAKLNIRLKDSESRPSCLPDTPFKSTVDNATFVSKMSHARLTEPGCCHATHMWGPHNFFLNTRGPLHSEGPCKCPVIKNWILSREWVTSL